MKILREEGDVNMINTNKFNITFPYFFIGPTGLLPPIPPPIANAANGKRVNPRPNIVNGKIILEASRLRLRKILTLIICCCKYDNSGGDDNDNGFVFNMKGASTIEPFCFANLVADDFRLILFHNLCLKLVVILEAGVVWFLL